MPPGALAGGAGRLGAAGAPGAGDAMAGLKELESREARLIKDMQAKESELVRGGRQAGREGELVLLHTCC